MDELKPCPFCGSGESLFSRGGEAISCYIYCRNCRACGPDVDDHNIRSFKQWSEKAIQAWNTRAEERKE